MTAAAPALRLVTPQEAESRPASAVMTGDTATASSAGWRAKLELAFERRAETTVLATCRHEGPLRVQKALHPEGPATAHAIILHPPGGIAGGDSLVVDVAAETGANALLTTPGAGKWYCSAGRPAAQSVRLRVGAGASLEWLPQETILFAGADARLASTIDLAADARYLGLEILCFGRTAAGERFDHGELKMRTQIRREGRLLWHENARLPGGCDWLEAAPGLAGFPVSATLLLAVPESPGAIDPELIAACRAIAAPPAASCGITCIGNLVVARCLCAEAEQAKAWFLELWTLLRPALLWRSAVMPRIWKT